jgi:hypothetical protein
MTKKLVLGFLAGVAVGALPSKLVSDGKDTFRLEARWANIALTKHPLQDGGVEVDFPFRACGYLYPEDFSPDARNPASGSIGRPCWTGRLTAAEAEGVFRAMLGRYDGGVAGAGVAR